MSGDGDMASVMGFSGFGMYCPCIIFILFNICITVSLIHESLILSGKKARTFDLDALFEQTRRTAIERSQRVLGNIIHNLDVTSY